MLRSVLDPGDSAVQERDGLPAPMMVASPKSGGRGSETRCM